DRSGRERQPREAAAAVRADRQDGRLHDHDRGEAPAQGDRAGLPDGEDRGRGGEAAEADPVLRRARARDLLPQGLARLLPHARLRAERGRLLEPYPRAGRNLDHARNPARRRAAPTARDLAALPADGAGREDRDGAVHAPRDVAASGPSCTGVRGGAQDAADGGRPPAPRRAPRREAREPDVTLLDGGMPRVDGWPVIDWLEEHGRLGAFPSSSSPRTQAAKPANARTRRACAPCAPGDG